MKKPLWEVGLGIRSLVQMNRALHGKWLRKCLKEEDSMWKNVVEPRWGSWDGRGVWGSNGGNYGTGLWKSIRERSY